MQRTQGDIVANTLDFYRARTEAKGVSTPQAYLDIKAKLDEAMNTGKRIIVDIRDSYNLQVAVIRLHSVQERWAMGYSTCYSEKKEIKVPYTIHYSDIYCSLAKVKIIVEGENPFD